MNRLLYIYIFSIIFSLKMANQASIDLSFLDLPLCSKSSSLGNTFLSDVGSSSNLLLNPSNIWFGDRVDNNSNIFKNVFLRANISNYEIASNNYYNILSTIQIGDGISIGFGNIGISQSNINHYDNNANYLGQITHNQDAYIFGAATRILGINIGYSGTYIKTNFYNFDEYKNNNDAIVSAVGLSMINKSINLKSTNLWQQIFIPSKISFHALSRNVISDISNNISISNNSLYKNVIGFKFNYKLNLEKIYKTHFLIDYKSNNNFTAEQIDIGWGISNLFLSNSFGNLSFNVGLRNFSISQFCWGIDYDISKIFNSNLLDLVVGYSSIGNTWGGQTNILTIKYSFDKN